MRMGAVQRRLPTGRCELSDAQRDAHPPCCKKQDLRHVWCEAAAARGAAEPGLHTGTSSPSRTSVLWTTSG